MTLGLRYSKDEACSRLETLLDIYNTLLTRSPTETVGLQTVCERISRLDPYCMAWIVYHGSEGGLQIIAAAGDRDVHGYFTTSDLAPEGAIHSPVGALSANATIIYRNDGAVVPRPVWARLSSELGVTTAIAAPISVNGVALGAIVICTRSAAVNDEQELTMVGSVAKALGGAIELSRGIKAREEAMNQLQMAGVVFENALEGILITDKKGNIVAANQSVLHATGYELHELIGKNPRLFSSGQQSEDFYKTMWHAIAKAGQWKGEIWNRRKNGEIYPEWLSIVAIRDKAGAIKNYVAIFTDISEQKRMERELHKLAFYDSLTGLANRTLFSDRLEHAVSHAARKSERLALLYVDLDKFKQINDTLGHHAGDSTLTTMAERMSALLRSDDTVARLGGDEFCILLESVPNPDRVATVAADLFHALSQPFSLDGHTLQVTASIGIAVYPDDGRNQESLLKCADTAMYHVKQTGRAGFAFYSNEMNRRSRGNLHLLQELRGAVRRDELVLHYQPKIDLASRKLMGVEALLRWLRPGHGLVPPGEFIPHAEESDLILHLGEWALREATRQCKLWHAQGIPISVAVNLSARQFERSDLPALLRDVLDDTGLAADQLELELTETVAMRDAPHTVGALGRLKDIGVSLAIDDFGTGYASLSYLKRFPVDTIKIDRSFIMDIETNPEDSAIVSAVAAMGDRLGKRVVAEGVEVAGQLDRVQECGCSTVQGFLFGLPTSGTQFAAVYSPLLPDRVDFIKEERRSGIVLL